MRGKLLAYDLSLLTSILSAEAMDDFIAAGINTPAKEINRSSKVIAVEKKREASVIRAFMKGLPLGVGFVLVSDIGHFWFGVKREFLSLNDLDIPLKFPTHISGEWSVLGIIDAVPHDHVSGLQSVVAKNIDGLVPAMVLNMMQLMGATTGMFGRPLQAGGLSPLMVYRDVGL